MRKVLYQNVNQVAPHTAHPEHLLREAKRVARHHIIIKDHYWDTPLDLLGLKIADYMGNAPYGIDLPRPAPVSTHRSMQACNL